MTTPKVSVLMPVYNGERYIRATIRSITEQTFAGFELIILDDGSTDGTFEILQSLAKQDTRIQLLRNEVNTGIVPTMNTLFELAHGDYINRHDADDISLPERFEQQVSFLDENPDIGMVSCRIQLIDAEGSPVEPEMFAGPLDNDAIQQQLLNHCCLCQSSVMFRRDCLQAVGFYDSTLEPSEDYDLWLRMAEMTRLVKLPGKLFNYRRHASSISFTRAADQLLFRAKIFENTYIRRFGPDFHVQYKSKLAREFLHSAIAIFISGRPQDARSILRHSLVYDANLFETIEPLETFITDHHNLLPAPVPIALYEALFDNLFTYFPAAYRLRARFLARLHMHEVFEGLAHNDFARIDSYLAKGLKYDPVWLLNRGVLRITAGFLSRFLHHRLGTRAS